MSGAVGSLRARIDAVPGTLALALGDLGLIALFVVIGELQHGYDVLAEPGRVVGTAIPFLVGWALASVAAGVYTPAIYRTPRAVAVRTALAWVGAALVGQFLRATPVFHGEFALPFVLVSLGVGLVLLVPWRAAVALLTARA